MGENVKEGDRVVICPHSQYYDTNPADPADVEGTVFEIDTPLGGLSVRVRWDNGRRNVYDHRDLIVVSSASSNRGKRRKFVAFIEGQT